jgi:hypothetical protein
LHGNPEFDTCACSHFYRGQTSKFDGMVIGNVSSISDEEHFQGLHLVLSTAELVRFFQLLKNFESEKDITGKFSRGNLKPSLMSSNLEFVSRVVNELKIEVWGLVESCSHRKFY